MVGKILNFGSLNIDYVYKVPHFVKPGETLASQNLETFSGGKGANQTTALARAGAQVSHAGKVGAGGGKLKEQLEKDGVDVHSIKESQTSNGHACIQVDPKGQNAILIYPGANREITKEEIDEALSLFEKGDYLLLQNEINLVDYLIEKGHKKNLKVCFNPAPMGPEVLKYPLHLLDTLIVNETEAKALARKAQIDQALNALVELYPNTELIVTIGAKGVLYRFQGEKWDIPAYKTNVIDTTGAGDTFTGYYLTAKLEGKSIEECLKFASKASALCVSKQGAQSSIPTKEEVLRVFS